MESNIEYQYKITLNKITLLQFKIIDLEIAAT